MRRPDPVFSRLDGFNKPRHDQLKRLLRQDRCPPLREIMSLQLGDPDNADVYAVMWGVCYDLLRGERMERQPISRLLQDAGALWGLDAARLFADCLREPDAAAFERAWNRRVTQAALARFEQILAANGTSLSVWERGWKERLLQVR
jgi:hypothetical protein